MKSSFSPKLPILRSFLTRFWFAPQDVLLRSVESSLVRSLPMRHPILDVGVGDASIADLFYPKSLTIEHGVDLDAEGIKRAKSSKKYKKVSVANAEKLPFKNSSFATVICNSTCEHITRDAAAIREMGRVLKKGGAFYLTVPSEYLPKMILELERFEGNENPKKALARFNKRVAHKHYHSLSDWRKIFDKAGLSVETYKYYFPENTTYTWYRLMRFSILKMAGREMWSWIGHSKVTPFLPKQLILWVLEHVVILRPYLKSFDTKDDIGGMIFIQGRKR